MICDIMKKKVSEKLLWWHKIGDYAKLCVPDIDRLKLDQRSLPCKILQQKPGVDSYQVGCAFGILENWYPANELELLDNNNMLALAVILLDLTISLRAAAIAQNSSLSRIGNLDNKGKRSPKRKLSMTTTSLPTNDRTKPVICQCVTTNCSILKCSCHKSGRLCTRDCGCMRRQVCKNSIRSASTQTKK